MTKKYQAEFKIDKNVKVPEDAGGGRIKYPFGKMDVGDSFLAVENAGCARAAAYNYAKWSGKKFASRSEGAGIRIWRIE